MKKIKYNLPNYKLNNRLYNDLLSGSHVLIAGATGSGKSVLIDNMIEYLITNSTPFNTKLVLIDPKKVSLYKYAKTPFCDAYASDNDEILTILDNCIDLMLKRYDYMQPRSMDMYDGASIYIFIDELADLMTTCKKDVLPKLQRIAQLGRASKIILIGATQCPNRIIIPALLTVNFNIRVALRCNDAIESKQIIKHNGAETLPQYGRCIYLYSDGLLYNSNIEYTDKKRLNNIIKFWTDQNKKSKIKLPKKAKQNTTFKNLTFKNVLYITSIVIACGYLYTMFLH